MSHDPNPSDDKLELHHRQQLSALVDGELSPDEARFLLRRLEHDAGLRDRFERWQLCGDVLRGQVRRAAGPELGARIAAAIAAAPVPAAAPRAPVDRRQAWTRWGGGAALAASVALVAMWVGRPAATDPSLIAAPRVAVQTLPSTEATLAASAPAQAPLQASPRAVSPGPAQVQRAPSPMVAAARPARTSVAGGSDEALAGAVADAGPLAPAMAQDDPFASPMPLQARPWPRAVLAQPAGSVHTARFGEPAAGASFYPFEPRLPAQSAPVALPEGDPLPAPPEQEGRR